MSADSAELIGTHDDTNVFLVIENSRQDSFNPLIVSRQALCFVQYTNRKPAYYLNRAFVLLCSSMSQRFISNEYVQTLTVIHPARRTDPPKRLATASPQPPLPPPARQ